MKIREALEAGGEFAVLADESHGIVRLWTLSRPFRDRRVLRALQRFFPDLQVRGRIIRLGGFRTLVDAQQLLAEAKVTSMSRLVMSLSRYDIPESAGTIRHVA